MKEKEKVFFEKLEKRDFDRIYYVEGSHIYYDLLALVDEPKKPTDSFKFLAIPVPIFAKEKMGIEITGKEIKLGKKERRDIDDYLRHLDVPIYSLSRDEYYDFVEEEKIRQEGIMMYDTLSEEEKELLEKVRRKGILLDEAVNQFGENVARQYIHGTVERGFTLYTLRCYSSESLGMGICQCVNHPTYREEPISLADVLEIAKDNAKEELKIERRYEIACEMKKILREKMEEDMTIENFLDVADYIQEKYGETITEAFLATIRVEGWVHLSEYTSAPQYIRRGLFYHFENAFDMLSTYVEGYLPKERFYLERYLMPATSDVVAMID